MEEGDDGAFEFGTATSVDGCGRESLPNNRLANVGRNEERDARAEAVTLLKELVEKDDDKGGGDKLNYK